MNAYICQTCASANPGSLPAELAALCADCPDEPGIDGAFPTVPGLPVPGTLPPGVVTEDQCRARELEAFAAGEAAASSSAIKVAVAGAVASAVVGAVLGSLLSA